MAPRVLAGTILIVMCPMQALAGAWTLPEGQGQAILSTTRTLEPVRAWFGDTVDSDSLGNQFFAEYGVWDDFTVGMTVFGEFSTTADEVEASVGIHARRRVWVGKSGDVISVQAGISAPVERWLGNSLGDNRPNSATEVDLRVLYGRGWQWDLGNSFISSEFGMRIRSEGLDEQLRFDVTAGHEPFRGFLFLTSMFASFPLGNQDEVSLKIAPSFAYTLWPLLGRNEKKPWQPVYPDTIQATATWDAARPGSGLEIGISIWKSF